MTTTPASGAADLIAAAQAVVDRWDTPLWKDAPATAEYIGRLRAALASAPAQPVAEPAPSATAHVGDSLFESWFSEYNPAHRGTKQQMRDAYAAGMGDPKAQPSPTPQAASSAVLKAIRAANMQLVRTGDDEFMLVTYKNAKAQCDGGQCGIGGYCDDCPTPQADSQPAPVLDSLALMRVVMRADEALAGRCTRGTTNWAAAIGKAVQDAVLAARAPADSVCYDYAKQIAESMWATHYKADAPHWESSDSLMGVLSQISNMMCGLSRAPADSVTAPAGGVSMREDFEAYWRSKYAPLPMNTRLHDDGRYGDPTIQQKWDSWRAIHTPTPPAQAADRQPAPDERDDFEKVFPLPSGCIRVGTGYASTGYSNWAAHTHCERWQGWQAHAAHGQAPAGANENAELVTLIAECRDAFPIPARGDPIENYWIAAIADPANVPAYLQEIAKRKQADSVQEDAALQLIADLVRHIDRETCTHEETHRGGAIWEICNSCGSMWADDKGGKPEFKWPDCVEKARAFLDAARKQGENHGR